MIEDLTKLLVYGYMGLSLEKQYSKETEERIAGIFGSTQDYQTPEALACQVYEFWQFEPPT